ncbi:Crp/Fnr family transcriptional regulator [Ramlibacter sp.]|uniref:Crp/Fnr family transcriptional regulator n=1 Tax=Ramlibacter sp. TaxID=1917967 RepID=UPI003D0DED7F
MQVKACSNFGKHPFEMTPLSLVKDLMINRSIGELSASERQALADAISGTADFVAGQTAVRQGQPVDVSLLLVEGMMTRQVYARDGRRHLMDVHLPGDFVDLHAYALKKLDHDVGALTAAKVAIFPHRELARIQSTFPNLTRQLWFLTLLDAAMHRQWIFRLASLDAIERIAHFLCEINTRLMAIGLSDGNRFVLPMTQVDLGEVCSLTNVHVSRVLRQLRERELCLVRASQVEILDLRRLAQLGQFEPAYLYFNRAISTRAVGSLQKVST